MKGLCLQCQKPSAVLVDTQDDGGLCPECLAFWTLPANKRHQLEAQGRKAILDESKARRGLPTEQRARESAERMATAGIAWLDKVPTNWRPCGRKGAFVLCVPAEKAIVDFVGHDGAGRVVAVEVKSAGTDDARFYLSKVPEQQRAYLDHVAATAFGLAYLLVDFPSLGAWYLLPWSVVRDWTRVAPEDEATRPYLADRETFLVSSATCEGKMSRPHQQTQTTERPVTGGCVRSHDPDQTKVIPSCVPAPVSGDVLGGFGSEYIGAALASAGRNIVVVDPEETKNEIGG